MGIIAWIAHEAIAGYVSGFLVRGDEGLGVGWNALTRTTGTI